MGVTFNTNKAMQLYKQSGGRTKFPNWLERILNYSQDDNDITDFRQLAYLLATGKVESDYSLQRWESDFVCGQAGVKYQNKPCQAAINYYCSTQGGKANYCKAGEMDKRGLPYFGRGLIQITWKGNYKKYGEKIGLGNKLVDNPELVMNPENSYLLAVAYMKDRGTFSKVRAGNLTGARISVNGGTRALGEVNNEYHRWLNILNKAKTNTKQKSGKGLSSKGKKNQGSTSKRDNTVVKVIIFSVLAMAVVTTAVTLYHNAKEK